MDLSRPAQILSQGGVVAFPTETVYGLGAVAFDASAVARVFEIKNRPRFDPLICHIARLDQMEGLAKDIPEQAWRLIEHFWPGALTLVLAAAPGVPAIVNAGLKTVAVRKPSHPVAHELIELVGAPLAAPSANSFGTLSPTTAQHVRDDLGARVDFVVDGGHTDWGVESTVVDVTGDQPVVLRYGAVSLEQLAAITPDVLDAGSRVSADVSAPGQMASHYAPKVQLCIEGLDGTAPDAAPLLSFRPRGAKRSGPTVVLSESGDLRQCAARLFDVLHQLEALATDSIWAELVPDQGLGRAINDRLLRARGRS